MANTDAPNGFTPAYHLYGGTIRPQKLRIESGTSAAIFSGDVVNLSSGYVIQGTATGTVESHGGLRRCGQGEGDRRLTLLRETYR